MIQQFPVEGHNYDVPPPRGSRALAVYRSAMRAMHAAIPDWDPSLISDAQLAGKTSDDVGRIFFRWASLLAARPEAWPAVVETLCSDGATVDGMQLNAHTIEGLYAVDRAYEPYLAALTLWARWRFFSVLRVAPAQQSSAPKSTEGSSGGSESAPKKEQT